MIITNYKIEYSKNAIKFIEKQSKIQRERIYKAIKRLPNGDVKKMKGYSELYKLRVGQYRIIYKHKENEIIILIMDVNNRGDIYKNY